MKPTKMIIWFVLLTIALSFSAYFIPISPETKTLLIPILLVFIPAIVSIVLTIIAEGKSGFRQLFSRAKSGIQWPLIGLLIGVGMRISVFIVGKLLNTPVKIDFSVPGTWFVIIGAIPFAYLEELGWRRFALDRLLKFRSPLVSTLLLGLPWGIIHLVITLPGMMSEGSPAIPQTIALICLGFLLTWVYIRSNGSVITAAILHGSQNGFIAFNRGLDNSQVTWLMMWAYLLLAVIFVVVDRKLFFKKPANT